MTRSLFVVVMRDTIDVEDDSQPGAFDTREQAKRSAYPGDTIVEYVPRVRCAECEHSVPYCGSDRSYCNPRHEVNPSDWFCADYEPRATAVPPPCPPERSEAPGTPAATSGSETASEGQPGGTAGYDIGDRGGRGH